MLKRSLLGEKSERARLNSTNEGLTTLYAGLENLMRKRVESLLKGVSGSYHHPVFLSSSEKISYEIR